MDSRGNLGPDGNRIKRATSLSFSGDRGVSKTQQHHAAGTRVDSILRQYETKGVDANSVGLFRWAHQPAPEYGIQQDFDYQTQLNNVIKVKEYFASLPSRTREIFKNDPGRMLRFMTDPKNLKQCQELGLLPKPKPKPEPEKKPDTGGTTATPPKPPETPGKP